MKAKNVLLLIILVFSSRVFASDQWRVFGPGDPKIEKSQYDPPPYCRWHIQNIQYTIESTPPGGFSEAAIRRSFNTWGANGHLSFSEGVSDITIETLSGDHIWFGSALYTFDETTGEITSMTIQLNDGTIWGDPVYWTDGNENSDSGPFYCDVQNTVTHEIGHALGIAHHSTGNGEPSMATRSQVSDFNTTLKRRTLETDDWLALSFLYIAAPTNLYVSGYNGGMPGINWTASTTYNVDHYELWWSETFGPPYGWQLLATTSATSWIDSRVTIDNYGPEDTYHYKARAVDQDGLKSSFSNEDEVHVDECPPWLCKQLAGELWANPEVYALGGNYPNPFNPTTTIRYDLPEASKVNLVIYDIAGREIRSWELQEEPGYKQQVWDGKNQSGRLASTGIYIYRLLAASVESDQRFTVSRKMLLMK